VTVLTHSESGHLLPDDSASRPSTPGGSILRWVDRTDAALLDELNGEFASMIYSTGVPFIFADHPKVVAFLQKLKPSWKPPSAKVIAGSLLTKQSTALKTAINTFVTDSKYVSLVSDGWSNIRREHMVNYVLVTPDHKPVLFGTDDTTEVVQNASAIAQALGKVIEEVGVPKVAGVVTDNAPNMVAAWKILEEKYPTLIANGCGAHTFNLLVKDICKLPEHEPVLEGARNITNFIMARGRLRKRFGLIQKGLVECGEMTSARVLVYVGETRWYTHHSCVARLLENKAAITQLITHSIFTAIDNNKRSAVMELISDLSFWTKLTEVEALLKPTSHYVAILEANTCCLSDVYRCFAEMTKAYQDNPQVSAIITSRWAFVHTESMSMAYFLDPRTEGGLGMLGYDALEATDNIVKYAIERRKIVNDVIPLKQEILRFTHDMANQSDVLKKWLQNHSPREYWLSPGRDKYPLLYCVADILFSIPSSQAASERVWSIYDFIHTKRRNRLSADKVTALVQLYINGDMKDNGKDIVNVLTGDQSDASEDDE